MSPKGFLLLVAITIFWGINWPIMKIAMTEIPVFTFRAIVLLGGGLCLFALCKAFGYPLTVPRREWKPLIAITIALFLFQILSGYGVMLTGSGRASVMAYTMPVWAISLGWLFLGEKPGWRRLTSLGLGMAGMVLLIVADIESLGGRTSRHDPHAVHCIGMVGSNHYAKTRAVVSADTDPGGMAGHPWCHPYVHRRRLFCRLRASQRARHLGHTVHPVQHLRRSGFLFLGIYGSGAALSGWCSDYWCHAHAGGRYFLGRMDSGRATRRYGIWLDGAGLTGHWLSRFCQTRGLGQSDQAGLNPACTQPLPEVRFFRC